LALCGAPAPALAFMVADTLPNALPPAIATVADLIRSERRSALRIVNADAAPPQFNLLIRDGVDDEGGLGEVNFPARSPDIIVVQQAPATPPEQAFQDLLDERAQDRIKAAVTNQIYVRVFNKGRDAANTEVNIWAVKFDAANNPDPTTANWIALPLAPAAAPTVMVPPNGLGLVNVPWANPPDPSPADAYKAWGIVVFIRMVPPVDPLPTAAANIPPAAFWQLFQGSPYASQTALRVLRYDP